MLETIPQNFPRPVADAPNKIPPGILFRTNFGNLIADNKCVWLSRFFKPSSVRSEMTPEELQKYEKYSREERIESVKGTAYSFQLPVFYDTTKENMLTPAKKSVSGVSDTETYQAAVYFLELVKRALAKFYGNTPIDSKNGFSEEEEAPALNINYSCRDCSERACYCQPGAPMGRGLLAYCRDDMKPVPLNQKCPEENHEGRCYCLNALDPDYPDGFNRLSVQDQQRKLRDLEYTPEAFPTNTGPEEPPLVFMEFIPDSTNAEHSLYKTPKTKVVRFIVVLPKGSSVTLGECMLDMVQESVARAAKPGGRFAKKPTGPSQLWRKLVTKRSVLQNWGKVLWKEDDIFTNPRKDTLQKYPKLIKNDDDFAEHAPLLLELRQNLRAMVSSESAKDGRRYNLAQQFYPEAPSEAFDEKNYYDAEGNFAPNLEAQRRMFFLDSEELNGDIFPILKKFPLRLWEHYREQFQRKFVRETGNPVETPTLAADASSRGSAAGSEIRHNPIQDSSVEEFTAEIGAELTKGITDPAVLTAIGESIKIWGLKGPGGKSESGSALNGWRCDQVQELSDYAKKQRRTISEANEKIESLQKQDPKETLRKQTRRVLHKIDYLKQSVGGLEGELLRRYRAELAEAEKTLVALRSKESDEEWQRDTESVVYELSCKAEKVRIETAQTIRKAYDDFICDSLKRFRAASEMDSVLETSKSVILEPKRLGHRTDNSVNSTAPWNPIFTGIDRYIAPMLGPMDHFISQFFHCCETLYFVSTHTGVVFYTLICSADGYTFRKLKNNFILMGPPDVGKSYVLLLCKDRLIVCGVVFMETTATETANRKKQQGDKCKWTEEVNPNILGKDPKFAKFRDEFKNKITAGMSTASVREQYRTPEDIVEWVTNTYNTLYSCHFAGSTNETRLKDTMEGSLRSRMAIKLVNGIQRNEGGRHRSDMSAGELQRTAENRRLAEVFDGIYKNKNQMVWLLNKLEDAGVHLEPTRVEFDLVVGKLKAWLRKKDISLKGRTIERMYGKAVNIMHQRVLATLFDLPKPDSKVVVGAVAFTKADPWALPEKDFQKIFIHENDLRKILSKIRQKAEYNNVRFVDERGVLLKRCFVDMGLMKAFEKGVQVYDLRLMQQGLDGSFLDKSKVHYYPKSCLGEFYKQWVSLHHPENLKHFARIVNPMLVISLEDTVQAIWQSRDDDIYPDTQPLFDKLLLNLGIRVLQNEALVDLTDKGLRNRKTKFRTTNVEVGENSSVNTNWTELKLGPIDSVVTEINNLNKGKSCNLTLNPEGFETLMDAKTIRGELIDRTKIKDQHEHGMMLFTGPSRVYKDEAFFGTVELAQGTEPDFTKVLPNGRVTDDDQKYKRSWEKWKPRANFKAGKGPHDPDRLESARMMYAERLHKHPNGEERTEGLVSRKPSRTHPQPICSIHGDGFKGGIGKKADVFLNINWIKQHWETRHTELERLNYLLLFFESLGYKHDNYGITEEEKIELLNQFEAKEKIELEGAREEDRQAIRDKWKAERERVRLLRLQQLKKILLGSPHLGDAVDATGAKKGRGCYPQLPMCVTVKHREKPWFSDVMNRPSEKAARMLGLSSAEANRQALPMNMPINAFGTIQRLHDLYLLPLNTKPEHFPALWKQKVLRWACPDHILTEMHKGRKPTDYLCNVPSHVCPMAYAAFLEQKNYRKKVSKKKPQKSLGSAMLSELQQSVSPTGPSAGPSTTRKRLSERQTSPRRHKRSRGGGPSTQP
tara:strand:- start:544 stop:5742 length:5199 start_codon:yes stop_codon:yes gene_type:complete